MTDTHAHLDWLEPAELEEALSAARDFRAILTIGTNPRRNRANLAIAEASPNVWAAVGLHPTEAHLLTEELEADLARLARHPRVRAVGETGLDYYWTPETRAAQFQALEFQAGLARELELPLIFHVRSKEGDAAERDVADWLAANRPPRVVLHAFGGHDRLTQVGLDLSAYFSFAGPLTYKKNQALREAAARLPPDRLMVETDTPFLPPEPHRGKPNQPAYARHTLARLALVRQMEVGELEKLTDQNAQNCFGFTAG